MVRTGGKRGPKPKGWTKAAAAAFGGYFGARTGRLPSPERGGGDDGTYGEIFSPVMDAGGVMQWTYLPEGGRPTRVRVPMAARCLHVASGRVGAVVRVGEGEHPDGSGTCEAYWLRGEAEVPADTAGATRLLRGGTGDVQLRYAGVPVGNIYRGTRRPWCSTARAPCAGRRRSAWRSAHDSRGVENWCLRAKYSKNFACGALRWGAGPPRPPTRSHENAK